MLAACGSDDEDASDTTAAATVAPTAAPTAAAGPGGDAIEVVASDYAFGGIPESVPVGTRFTLTNASDVELHELVVVKRPEGEDRSIEELLALPEEESDAIFGPGPPAMVLLVMPGSDEVIPAVGDGTISEPGDYIAVCFIPQGVDPVEFMAAAEASGDGPPDVEGTGPPHAFLGMTAEFTVKG